MLITIADGAVSYEHTEGLDLQVEIFDFDYPDEKVSFAMKGLAEKAGVPVIQIETESESLTFIGYADDGNLEKVMEMADRASPSELRMALEGAVYSNHCPVIDFLINLPVDIEHNTALWMASAYGHPSALKLLGTKYDFSAYQSKSENTLLSAALSEAYHDDELDMANNKEVLEFLVEACKMDINHQAANGNTLLHNLLTTVRDSAGRDEEIIHILRYRPDVELKDNNGVSIIGLLKASTSERLISLADELSAEGEGASPR